MYKVLGYNEVHKYVDRTPQAQWNGWTVEYFTPNPAAWRNPKGSFRNGKWGFVFHVRPDKNGKWRVKV